MTPGASPILHAVEMVSAGAALMLTGTIAEAKCGTSQLNGTWIATLTVEPAVGDAFVEVNEFPILNGLVDGGPETISQTIGCKVTLNLFDVILTGRSDRIPSTSKAKPGLVSVGIKTAEGTVLLHMVRK